jgi:hypothetical protein
VNVSKLLASIGRTLLRGLGDPNVAWAPVVLTLCLTSLVCVSSVSAARRSDSKVVLPCFHKGTGHYTDEVQPKSCDLAGRRNEKKFVEVPVTGMRWSKWGMHKARGSHGKTMAFTESRRPGGTGVRVIAYRRVACGDGRMSYSWVDVFFPGGGLTIEIKLPPCSAGDE